MILVPRTLLNRSMPCPRIVPRTSRSGFSLIEAVTAVALVTIACSAMLFAVEQAIQATESSRSTNRANSLAQDLMDEISACHWSDPSSPQHWGPEDDEIAKGARSGFDDLDDYDRWSGPPQTRDGVPYDVLQGRLFPTVRSAEYAQYTCSVTVSYVSSAGEILQGANNTSTYRQVTVTVTHPRNPPVKLRRIFADLLPLLGRNYWYDPNVVEAEATVTVVPADTEAPILINEIKTITSGVGGGIL